MIGRVVVSNNGGLFYVGAEDKLKQFSRYDYDLNQAQVVTDIVAKNSDLLLSTECRVNRDNSDSVQKIKKTLTTQ